MGEKYYGGIGVKSYNGVVKIIDGYQAYIYDRWYKVYRRNDDYLKAMYDPGSEYDEISKEKAEEIIRGL